MRMPCRCFEPGRDLAQHLLARRDFGAAHLVRPDRAGVVDIGIDLACRERLERSRLEPRPVAPCRREAGRLQPLLHQRRQHVLLGERLGADDVTALVRAKAGASAADDERASPLRRPRRCAGCGASRAALHQRQQLVDARAPAAPPPRSRTARTPSSASAGRRRCSCRGWSGRSASTASRCRSPTRPRCGCRP